MPVPYTLLSNGYVQREDGAIIPPDPDNRDYAAFLAWRDAGNTPGEPPPVAPVVPQEITNFQARAVLRNTFLPDGTSMLTAVTTNLKTAMDQAAGLPENDPFRIQVDLAWQAWEMANTLSRTSPLVLHFAGTFGLSPAQLDAMFIQASTIGA